MNPSIGDVYLHKKSGRHYVIGVICKHGKTNSNLPDVAVYYELNGANRVYYRKIADFNRSQDSGYKYISNIHNSSSLA